MTDSTEIAAPGRFWPQLRRFLIFQFKLYIDALRDFVLSFLSFWAFLLDVVTRSYGEGSHFERVLKLGRRTERVINLFEQYDTTHQDGASVDTMIRNMESRFGQKQAEKKRR